MLVRLILLMFVILTALQVPCTMLVDSLFAEPDGKKMIVNPGAIYSAVVERVVDGDTVHCLIQMRPEVLGIFVRAGIRLAGIDTPESNGKCEQEKSLGKRATEALSSLLPVGAIVILTDVGRDKFRNRVTSIIYTTRGDNVAEQLRGLGLAKPYTGRGPKPDWCANVAPSGKKETS